MGASNATFLCVIKETVLINIIEIYKNRGDFDTGGLIYVSKMSDLIGLG